MLRLLHNVDVEFMKTFPGYTGSIGKTFRIKRARLFRQYLRDLETDFLQINGAIRMVMLNSQIDRPDYQEPIRIRLFENDPASSVLVVSAWIWNGIGR